MSRTYQRPGLDTPNGIYVYNPKLGEWVLTEKLPFKQTGFHIIYFDNTRCSACRRFDSHWFSFVEEMAFKNPEDVFMIVLCDWFSKKCNSAPAKRLFEIFDIHVSPTVAFVYRVNGSVKRFQKEEGLLEKDKLAVIYIVSRTLFTKEG